MGILLGFSFVVEPKDFRDLQAHVQTLANDYNISFPQLPGFSIPEIWNFYNDGREFQVGENMKARGLSAEFPVVLIPGIVSTVRQRYMIYRQTSQP